MTPEQHLEEARRFLAWPMLPYFTRSGLNLYLLPYAAERGWSREDERAIRRQILHVARTRQR